MYLIFFMKRGNFPGIFLNGINLDVENSYSLKL
jgi:hypothetical protein